MRDWDVATFIEALEEAYPLAPGDRHLGHGQRWLDVAYSMQKIKVRNEDMASLRTSLIADVINAVHTIGEIPAENLQEVLKLLRRCFTCSENPHRSLPSNKEFQRSLEIRLDTDPVYKRAPSLNQYFFNLTMLITEWEKAHQQQLMRTTGRFGGGVPANNQPQSNKGRTSAQTPVVAAGDASITCEGCGRLGHTRPNCSDRLHPDFNASGSWIDIAAILYQEKHCGCSISSRAHQERIPLSIDTRDWMGQNINQSILRHPLRPQLAHRRRQPPLPLHKILVVGRMEGVEEEATRAAMDEIMGAGMEKGVTGLVSNSSHQVHLIVPTPSHT
jgi:hypothetical protein